MVIQLNTPGGSLDATQRIVSTLLEAPLPTIVWVAPSGARAASAGTFITLAGHVALMAPGTNIGAATPVGGQGEDIEGDLGQKVLNDAIASIRSIAETRGRNADWAERDRARRPLVAGDRGASRSARSTGSPARSRTVLAFADGRTVDRGTASPRRSRSPAPRRDELAMNPFQEFLHLLSDPNIAFILFTIGFYGLLFELQNPNFVTGILGALAIILAFIGFGSLPLNVAGLLLILLAIVLFGLELTVTSHGLLGAGRDRLLRAGRVGPVHPAGRPVRAARRGRAAGHRDDDRDRRRSSWCSSWRSPSAAGACRHRPAWSARGGPVAGRRRRGPAVDRAARLRLRRRRGVDGADRRWPPLERGTPVRVVATDGLTLIVEPDPSSSSQA